MRKSANCAALDYQSPHRAAPFTPSLDLVHLSHQTLGDSALEAELLALFTRQAGQIADRLAAPSAPGDHIARADLAHTLKGSARAVGAFAVGDAADAYEAAARSSAGAASVWPRLEAAIAAVRAEIALLLGRG